MNCPSCGHDNVPGADACAACLTSLTHEDIPPEEARNRVEHSLMEDRVADLRPAAPISVGESTCLDEAVKNMRAKRIGCLLVTDTVGKLVGILTERDLLNKVAAEMEDFSRAVVADFMTRNPETIEPERPLGYALQRMLVGDLRHLPLVDRDGKSVGIISSRDVVRHVAALVGAD
jgi:CBS domain-containing protein